MATDDRTLVARILTQGDQRAYAELVRRYQSRLRYSLRQLCGWDEALADDLAQEAFIKAFRNLASYRGHSQFFTWLYSIAYRVFLSHRRAQKPTEPLDEAAADANAPDLGSETALHRDFSRALQSLPLEQAVALHLHLHCEFTHGEIADIMGSPLGTVKSHIQRGREKLKTLLSSWQDSVPLQEAQQP